MFARDRAVLRPLPIVAFALIAWLAPAPATRGAETVTIGDLTFVNQALVGVGRLPSDLRDKFGATFGSCLASPARATIARGSPSSSPPSSPPTTRRPFRSGSAKRASKQR